jgi:hypothetical protein
MLQSYNGALKFYISTLKLLNSIACELHLLAQILGIKVAFKNHTNESNPFTNLESPHNQSATPSKIK